MARDYWFSFGSGNPSTYSGLAPTFIVFINNAGTTYAPPAITERTSSGLYQVSFGATQTMAFVMDGATTGLASSDRYIAGVMDPYDQFGVTLNAVYAVGVSGLATGVSGLAVGTTLLGYGVTALAGITALGPQGVTILAGLTALGPQGVSITAQGVSILALVTSDFTALGVTLGGLGTSLTVMGVSLLGLGLVIGSTASSYGSTSIDPVDLYGYLKRLQELGEGNQTYTKATGLLDLFIRGGGTLLREKTISDTATTTTKT